MKDTGMARKVDDLGRIVLPVELRRLHGIRTGDALEISVDGDAIVLRKVQDGCVFCGGGGELVAFRDRQVCGPCAEEFRRTGPTGGPDGGGTTAREPGAAPSTPAAGAPSPS